MIELGLKCVTHLANHYTVPDLIRLAQLADDKGFCQLWFNDNIRYRNQFVVMSAVAARVRPSDGRIAQLRHLHSDAQSWQTAGNDRDRREARP